MPDIDFRGNNSGELLNRHLMSSLALVLVIQVLGFLYYFWFLTRHGYLPSPFFYYKHEVLMDLFGPLFWSDTNGIYTAGSFYPPLNYIFL